MTDNLGPVLGLAAALGGGLLIGLERERRKGRGPDREAAGIRSFALAALGGGIAQALQQPLLVALGAALVAALVAVAYWKSLQRLPGRPEPDPGLTTELSLFITYLVGVLSVQQPVLGAASAAIVAGLLAAREKLHRLATELMTQAELHDALVLAALVLVLLPLAPSAPVLGFGGLTPRSLLLTAVLILSMQAAGHVALRWLGLGSGLALSGFFSGFVSSTATIASMGSRVKAQAGQTLAARHRERGACAAGALFSTVATWVQMLLLVSVLSPGALPLLLPAALAGAAVAAATALLQWRSVRTPVGSDSAALANVPQDLSKRPLRLREALLVTLVLAAVSVLVGWAQRHHGSAGVLLGSAIAALTDAHAPVAALAALQASGQLDSQTLLRGALVAVAANAVTRTVTAFVAGGVNFGLRVAASLLLSTGAAAVVGLSGVLR
jgi:uncharacterized membrane protein (DUF4010 family)